VFLTLGLAALIYATTLSPSFRHCQSDYETREGDYRRAEFEQALPWSSKVYVLPVFLTCEGIFIDANGTTIAAFATVLIAAFTFTLWRSTDRLWEAGERQLKETARTAKAAEQSAEAVVSQLRAYLSLKVPEGLPPRFGQDTGPWCAFLVRNTGQTPAFRMTYWIHAGIGPVNLTGPLPSGADAQPHPLTLAPDATINIRTQGPPPQKGDFEAFTQGRLAAYVWGEINYTDAFANPRFHRFRYTYGITDIAGDIVGVRLCAEGNEAN
jgi:hypothetical protein